MTLNLAQRLLQQGRALANARQDEQAAQLFRQAITLEPGLRDAHYELGTLYHRQARLGQAEETFRGLLRLAPDYLPAKLGLGAVLIDDQRPVEAETLLRDASSESAPLSLKAAAQINLGMALRRQRKDQEALHSYDTARELQASPHDLALHRAEVLQNLERYQEALEEYRQALRRFPLSPLLHRHYNHLLYRLGRDEEFLRSYQAAPKTPDLLFGRALLLLQVGRPEEACRGFGELLVADVGDRAATIGAVNALITLRRLDEATDHLELALTCRPDDVLLLNLAAVVALLRNDPELGVDLCDKALAISPHDQPSLATVSIGARMLGDQRDEMLNDYERFIQVFDLPAPDGFTDMESFNAELSVYLKRMHPPTSGFIDQSLRGGTQTPDHLFGAGHALVEKLRLRIEQAVQAYVSGLGESRIHPFLSRRCRNLRYGGSWSSQLKSFGYHLNHIHPTGWISSCYYVEVPKAVEDEAGMPGWIKFGEPSFPVQLSDPVRRTVRPVPGRLVLFPSYTWHGTVPFEDGVRTTLAFDVVAEAVA